ncbi:hypothetical protein [Nocardia lasii]|uniref:Sensor domain-containing protein n=1 Tax=Nocardia lasii TaxID=1616107 RepID=A0ABW1JJC4_9NOCA
MAVVGRGRWFAVVSAGVVALAGCSGGAERPAIVALTSLPRLAEYPAGYSLLEQPGSISAEDPGTAMPLTFVDDRCRPVIENPVGAGARESVASGTNPAVFLVQIVESDLAIAELTDLVRRCADVEATSGNSTLRMTVAPANVPKTVAAESIAIRTTGTQEKRVGDAEPTRTPIAQQRFLARVGNYVLSALVMLSPMPEQGLAAELDVLARVFQIAVDRLTAETR